VCLDARLHGRRFGLCHAHPPPPPAISVSVTPPSASVLLGNSRTLTATVTNTTDTSVAWSVNNIPGGSQSTGTITAAGVYTPSADLPSPAIVHSGGVRFRVSADPRVRAHAGIQPLRGVCCNDVPLRASAWHIFWNAVHRPAARRSAGRRRSHGAVRFVSGPGGYSQHRFAQRPHIPGQSAFVTRIAARRDGNLLRACGCGGCIERCSDRSYARRLELCRARSGAVRWNLRNRPSAG
jgi:hypothetical protein